MKANRRRLPTLNYFSGASIALPDTAAEWLLPITMSNAGIEGKLANSQGISGGVNTSHFCVRELASNRVQQSS
jgi:hypothetical protein